MFACLNLQKWAEWLDTQLRFADLAVQRTNGAWVNEKLQLHRHPLDAILWPAVVAGAVFTGMPTFGSHFFMAIGVMVVTFAVFLMSARFSFRKEKIVSYDLRFQGLYLLALCVLLWVSTPETAQTYGPYQHALIPITIIVAVTLLVAPWMATRFFAPLRSNLIYQNFLEKTELFQQRAQGQLAEGVGGVILQVISNILPRLPLLLWCVAGSVLIFPREWVTCLPPAIGAIVFFVLVLAALDERLDLMVRILSARLFRNAALFVSLAIIALGYFVLIENTYVTTLLDTVAWGEVILYLFFIYALTWWYDYWVERLVGQELLQFISPRAAVQSVIRYRLQKQSQETDVPHDRRILQIHGIGRFLVYRANSTNVQGNNQGFHTVPFWRTPPFPSFHSWSYRDFFYRLAVVGSPGGTQPPLPEQIDRRMTQFSLGVGAIVSAFFFFGYVWVKNTVQLEEVAVLSNQPAAVSLQDLLAQHNQERPGKPAIFVAASGGGTRAALYTEAALEGLVAADLGDDIILGSGVSGGGAALAYFASNRPTLIGKDQRVWDTFSNTMSEPFIQDVLEKASEGRIIKGGRLGQLLAESFRDRWHLTAGRNTFGSITDFGLILNTALAAHLDLSNVPDACQTETCFRWLAHRYRKSAKSDLAGGRLIFTNLALHTAFEKTTLPLDLPKQLPIVIDDKNARLEYAAALNANFPPVFSNAAVDVDYNVRYWVTDGGAADNRGMEMLFYALRHALRGQQHTLACQNLPPVRIIVLDASALEESFKQDRGVGSALGAGAQFAHHLVAELRNELQNCYQAASQDHDFQFHYMPMPRMLREFGSFGTHWMLQRSIRVKHGDEEVTVSGKDVVKVLRQLYGNRPADKLSKAGKTLLAWACSTEEYTKWKEFIQSGTPCTP